MCVNPTFALIFVTVKMQCPTFDFPTPVVPCPLPKSECRDGKQHHLPRSLEVEAASGKMIIFYEFSIGNSGASSGDVIKNAYTAGETGVYSAFANSCPLQTDSFLFPFLYSHNVLRSSNKF